MAVKKIGVGHCLVWELGEGKKKTKNSRGEMGGERMGSRWSGWGIIGRERKERREKKKENEEKK